MQTCRLPVPHFLKAPPAAWFAYPETGSLPWAARRRIWLHFLLGLRGRNPKPADAWAGRLPRNALQRLGRIGALFPDDLRSKELQDLLRWPLHDSMESPEFAAPGPIFDDSGIRAGVQAILRDNGRPPKYLDAVMKRLEAAQRP